MGKPLISDAAMLGMYTAVEYLQHARRDRAITHGMSRAHRAALQQAPEALYAALLGQLHRRDTLLTPADDPFVTAAVESLFHQESDSAADRERAVSPHTVICDGADDATCASIALGFALRTAQARRIHESSKHAVTVALLRGFPSLDDLLPSLDAHAPSLLIVVQGEPEERAAIQRRAKFSKVPFMPVDATDAVAICRVVQESLLRARHGWGAVVVHALRLPHASDPLAALRAHLQARHLI